MSFLIKDCAELFSVFMTNFHMNKYTRKPDEGGRYPR